MNKSKLKTLRNRASYKKQADFARPVIYAITCKNNDRSYIGSTTNWYRRRTNHLSYLRGGSHHNKLLQQDFNLHGESSFEFIVLSDCPEISLRQVEQVFINVAQNPYNLRPAL